MDPSAEIELPIVENSTVEFQMRNFMEIFYLIQLEQL